MDRGNGTPARYTECFEWMLAPTDSQGQNPRPDLGADVINDSWTCPPSEGCTDPDVLESVVDNVRAAGIAVVFAAGNEGSELAGVPECFTVDEPPAIYQSAISVGATWLDDTIASFSSIGPVSLDGSNRLKPDLVGPGRRPPHRGAVQRLCGIVHRDFRRGAAGCGSDRAPLVGRAGSRRRRGPARSWRSSWARRP